MTDPQSVITGSPLPPGQVWVITSVGSPEFPGLYKVDVTEGPGSGVEILNRQPRPHSSETWPSPELLDAVRCAEQTLYVLAQELVGDRDPRQRQFSLQLQAFDFARSGWGVGLGILVALCSSLLQKSIKSGLVVTGGLDWSHNSICDSNPGWEIQEVYRPDGVVSKAAKHGASSVLMPIGSRRTLFALSDDLATKVAIHYYADVRDAVLKALTN